ncbi:hypothetical protein [Paraburkholderia sp. SIMBA_053]|uniref:hypothetical protein n=1 Tax=Paraburkholderia sp. SIMBA_053 TaxID=3085794 RepID=UPI0039791030
MMTRDQFERELSPLLRERPPGTVALLADCLAAYWNGHATVFAFLCEHGSGAVDEEFDLDDYVWEEWQPALEAWLADPMFSTRPEVVRWLADAPPFEAGT